MVKNLKELAFFTLLMDFSELLVSCLLYKRRIRSIKKLFLGD